MKLANKIKGDAARVQIVLLLLKKLECAGLGNLFTHDDFGLNPV